MSAGENTAARAGRIDDFVVMAQEIAALVRAGVPLESSLAASARDMPGRLGHQLAALAEELSRGRSLAEAVARRRSQMPPECAAVVAAGARSGDMAAALDGMVVMARARDELRRTAVLAVVYPLVIALVAWGVLAVVATFVAPVLLSEFRGEQLAVPTAMSLLEWFATLPVAFWLSVPSVVVAVVALWLWSAGRAAVVQPGWARLVFGWMPGTGRLIRQTEEALAARLLSVLVERRLPLPEALRLSADTAHRRRNRRACERLATALERGEDLQNIDCPGGTPIAALRWLLAAGGDEALLARSLSHMAERAEGRARRTAALLQSLIPPLLVVLIGGTAVALLALALFGPWTRLMYEMGQPIGWH